MKGKQHNTFIVIATIVCGFLFVYSSRFLVAFPFFAGPDMRKLFLAIVLIAAATSFFSVRIFSLPKEAVTGAHILLALLGTLCVIGAHNLDAAAKFFGLFSIYDDYESAGFLLLFIMLTVFGLAVGFALGRRFPGKTPK